MFDSIKKIFGGKPSQDKTQNQVTAEMPTTDHEMTDAPVAEPAPQIEYELPLPSELRLEAVFSQAAHEPKKRTDFLNALMETELYVIGKSEKAPDDTDGPPGEKINIQLATQIAGQEPVALAFTSRAAMQKAGVPMEQAFVKIKTLDFVRMINNQLGFLLNPGNRVAKQFTKWEVGQLAGGGLASIQEVQVPADKPINVGQPSQYPPGLIEALRSAVIEATDISAIHTGLMSANEATPSVLLAVISTTAPTQREEFLTLVNALSTKLVPVLNGQALNFAPLTPSFQELIERRALVNVSEVLA